MARVTKTLTPVRGRRYRVTRLDACGNPVYGDNAQVVTSGVVTASFTALTSETDEIRVVNSSGDTCVLEPSVVSTEGYSAEIQFCGMDPDMFEIMTGMPVIYDIDGAAVGIAVDVGVDMSTFSFALEVWTGVASDEACGEVGEVNYGYILLPYMKGGRLSDFTVENGAINFTIADATSRKGGSWGKGPYDVVVNSGSVPGPLLSALTSTQVLVLMLTKVAPPAAAVGGRPLLDPANPTLSSVTGVVTGSSVDFTTAPAIPAGQGVYYEFGDGTWDYVVDVNGDTTHVYDDPGTYTVRASANGDFVTTSVTVS